MIKYTHEPKHCILLASASDQEENVENQILDMQRMNSASPHQRTTSVWVAITAHYYFKEPLDKSYCNYHILLW